MTKQEMMEYYENYNKENFNEMAKHHTDDVVFQSGEIYLSGKEVIEMFKDFREYFYHVTNPLSVVFGEDLYGEDKICVEMNEKIECTKDGGKLHNKTYQAGEVVRDGLHSVFYTLRNGKITKIKNYRLFL